MRSHGYIKDAGIIIDVYFKGGRFDIYNLAYKYILLYNEEEKIVYVDNMKELKEEILKMYGGFG